MRYFREYFCIQTLPKSTIVRDDQIFFLTIKLIKTIIVKPQKGVPETLCGLTRHFSKRTFGIKARDRGLRCTPISPYKTQFSRNV